MPRLCLLQAQRLDFDTKKRPPPQGGGGAAKTAKRNDDSSVSAARARYLARKQGLAT